MPPGNELDRQLHKGGIGLEQKLEMTGRLMLLSRFAAKMLSLVEAPSVPLYSAYLELRSLLAELAAFRPGQAVFAAAAYDHDNPYPVFKELDIKIRREIKPAGGVFLKVPFEMTAQKNMQIPVAKLTAEHFAKPNAYFLAVKTKADPTALARYVEDGAPVQTDALEHLERGDLWHHAAGAADSAAGIPKPGGPLLLPFASQGQRGALGSNPERNGDGHQL